MSPTNTQRSSGPGLPGLEQVTARLNAMVAEGLISQAEAEGILQAFLDRSAPAETGEVTAKRIRQLDRARRELVEGMQGEVDGFHGDRMSRARAALLAIPDEEWEAAGGSLGEEVIR